ncbi:Hypothetical predicted protein [Mytilus galloprovincialis]|uniref:DDE-1 domain-containing protein n=1 Tax=Mytilus galloprovincialis TaxID=29158 RepID=A0A8B6GHU5_MYTGA|nr:Hypothetical predicted protein [Mytilus galloprovincialis]
MESDVIVEGFLKANDNGIRYMNFIADGDSSMHAQIMDRVPVWGKHVKKLECANHITKCLRSNLEKLVTEKPSYKGKGKLCKRTRVRIVSSVRCAIRKRSDETNRILATKKLEHAIRNTTSHIYGDHKLFNPDFCKAKSKVSHHDQNQDDDSEVECEDIFQEQSEFWDAGTSLQAQEDSRGNKATRIGLLEERITIQEYINIKAKDNIEIKVEPCGLIIDKKFKYLAASPDGKVIDKENNEIGLIEIKNLVHDKNLTLTQAAISLKNFCLEKVSSGTNTNLQLKNNHNYFYQCQALLHIYDSPWIDFVVKTLNPYDIFIQRIEKNTALWKKMVAKLTAFYDLALLPEIASPRHKKYPGIREPGNWYADENNIKKKTPSLKKKERKRKDLTTDDEEEQGPSNLNDHKKTIRRTRRKCSQLKFLGRRISHERIEEDNNSKWYSGTVTGVLTETDGADGAEYEVNMTRTYVRKTNRGTTPHGIMERAMSCVVNEHRSVRSTASEFEINHMTLTRFIKKCTEVGSSNVTVGYFGNRKVFNDLQEQALERYLLNASYIYFGLAPKKVRRLAYECAEKFSIHMPQSWVENKCAGLGEVMDRYKFSASDIWNIDETGITTVQKPSKTVGAKGVKQVGGITSAGRGYLVTVCRSVNAIGNTIPPMMIFPRKHFKDHFIRDGPQGVCGGAHPSGWMTAENFLIFLQHFVKHIKPSTAHPVLLLLDNHNSHLAVTILAFAKLNGIVMLSFPPHCSHKLQPLDRTVYGPLKIRCNSTGLLAEK